MKRSCFLAVVVALGLASQCQAQQVWCVIKVTPGANFQLKTDPATGRVIPNSGPPYAVVLASSKADYDRMAGYGYTIGATYIGRVIGDYADAPTALQMAATLTVGGTWSGPPFTYPVPPPP